MERRHSFSGLVQVDAAAGVEEAGEFGSGGAQVCRCVAKGEVEDENKKGENGKGCRALFIRKGSINEREKLGRQRMII